MNVANFMKDNAHELVTASADTGIREAMALLLDNKISCLLIVTDENELVGIVSEKDIFRSAYEDSEGFINGTLGEIMTTDLIVGIAEDDLDYIAGLMTENRIRHIPIVESKQLKGLLSLGDIVKSRMTSMKIENRYLKMYIEDVYPG